MIQPLHDRVLIRRLEEPDSLITLTDKPKGIKGVILAVGPGKWIEGINGGMVRKKPEVKTGDIVLFNSKWNDFSASENRGTGADGSGPLERPLPLTGDPMVHLVREADIFVICDDPKLKASIKICRLEQEYMQTVEIKGPWNGGDPAGRELMSVNGRISD
jgi:co-chaperonin GroES (HSP10)